MKKKKNHVHSARVARLASCATAILVTDSYTLVLGIYRIHCGFLFEVKIFYLNLLGGLLCICIFFPLTDAVVRRPGPNGDLSDRPLPLPLGVVRRRVLRALVVAVQQARDQVVLADLRVPLVGVRLRVVRALHLQGDARGHERGVEHEVWKRKKK